MWPIRLLTRSGYQADYHDAMDRWLKRHKPRTVLCLVQFLDIELARMPSLYLATPEEIGQRLHATAKGRGDTILYERHEWSSRTHSAGTIEELPSGWRFSPERIEALSVS
jgi:hypothetical protein